jgi:hypothetical protein
MEEFRKIQGYDNYSVSNFGNVRNDTTRLILQPIISTNYYIVNLYRDNKKKSFHIHRLVALTFIQNPENKKCVDHIDNNKLNNNVNNLRWATITENNRNKVLSSRNTSGVKGVMWLQKRKKWKAQVKIDGKSKHLGYFDNLEDAKKARQNEANRIFGDFTNACEKIIHINVNININVNQEQLELEELEKELERIINL